MHYLYILRSQKTGRFYIGQTSDVTERLKYHNLGTVKSTKAFVPWEIAYVQEFPNSLEAIRRERYIKAQKSKRFIEELIKQAST